MILWLFNHKRADFLASKFWNFISLFSVFKIEKFFHMAIGAADLSVKPGTKRVPGLLGAFLAPCLKIDNEPQ